MPPAHTCELEVHALSSDGRAVCRQGTRVIFVEGGLPGQRIHARILRSKKRFAEGVRTAVLSPAPDAVPPVCPHADACGGCPLQEMPYTRQLYWKERILRDALTRIGKQSDAPIAPILPSPALWEYRNKMEFAFAPDPESGLRLGLRQRGSHTVVDVVGCRLLPAPAMHILKQIRTLARATGLPPLDMQTGEGFWRFAVLRLPVPPPGGTPQRLVHCITSGGDAEQRRTVAEIGRALLDSPWGITGFVHAARDSRDGLALGERTLLRLGQDTLTEYLGGRRFIVPHNGFFQINTPAAEFLCAEAAGMAYLQDKECLWDLYCGVGAPGLCLAGQAGRVFGVESTPEAVEHAANNAEAAGYGHCRYAAGDVRKMLRRLPRPDVVLADPPRGGLHPDVVEALLRAHPRRIVYISCNPATLARDVRLLATGYGLGRVQPVDLFPHTPHVESVCVLDRKSGA